MQDDSVSYGWCTNLNPQQIIQWRIKKSNKDQKDNIKTIEIVWLIDLQCFWRLYLTITFWYGNWFGGNETILLFYAWTSRSEILRAKHIHWQNEMPIWNPKWGIWMIRIPIYLKSLLVILLGKEWMFERFKESVFKTEVIGEISVWIPHKQS